MTITGKYRARWLAAAGSAVLVLAAGLLAPAQAQADPGGYHYKHWKQYVYASGEKKVSRSLCADYLVTATVRFYAEKSRAKSVVSVDYKNTQVLNVAYKVFFYNRCDANVASNRKRVKVSTVSMSGSLAGAETHGCSLNPSLSVALPFSISVSVAPTCGKSKQKTAYTQQANVTQHVSEDDLLLRGRVAQFSQHVHTTTFYDRGQHHNVCFSFPMGFTITTRPNGNPKNYPESVLPPLSCFNIYNAPYGN